MISQVKDMNEILEQALLYDFYGELLTDHQKEVYEQFVLEDLSLGEIAREEGIDRKSTRLNSSHASKSRMPSSA